MTFSFRNLIKGDRVIWTVLLLLSLMSLLIIYSATAALAYRNVGGMTWHYLIRQLVFISVGFGVILVMVHVIPIKLYNTISQALVIVSIVLLVVALLQKFSGRAGDSVGRTLNLGFISFQPAELAKIALIMFASRILSRSQKSDEDLFKAFKSIIIYTVIVCGLIFFSNFSTAALLFGVILTMMFIARVPLKYIGMVLGIGLVMVIIIYFTADYLPGDLFRFSTIKGRINDFIYGDPSANNGITQADYAKLAIFEGGMFGKGPGHSDVSNYMASAYNDFIFAIIVEEYGLVIGSFIILLYLIFLFRGVVIVRRANRTFPAFLVTGLTLLLVYQAMINIGVSSGVLPVTGQPLPWVSMGGTSTLFTSASFGCILSVSYQNQKNKQMQEETPIKVNVPDEDEAL
jgi:cell division protein FtsW